MGRVEVKVEVRVELRVEAGDGIAIREVSTSAI